ncbi:hypothetical protein GE253_19320 [Niveispirillum sp. SYP-B3756]|uniref:hypothetical protein n=1 Tax=Niveispirillum sp. SYP-B3756 TaxID=2662178 RepID=UPI001290B32D|nr:hypothetical protein [Niveispirillum sp. SYP-B3756]MQP67482.1 hypothetical protein [Niveispirillum sp. SYP-B3756]
MSYGLYDHHRRYRRRFWARIIKLGLWLLVLGGVAGFSYLVGVEQLKSRQGSMQEELANATAAKDKAERRAGQLQQIAQSLEVKTKELEIRLQREVPSGELARLSELLSRKLAEGVKPERIAFLLEQASNPRSCARPETKRFVLPTPIYRGANTSVAFADGSLVVTGEGVPARNAGGSPEAWYDPTKPVTLRISNGDAPAQEISGVLPLQHSLIASDKEVKLTVSAGARSFVEVTGEVCRFP